MKKNLPFLLIILFIFSGCSSGRFTNFITAEKDKLIDGKNELRFISFNIPNLHYIEDQLAFDEPNPWRLPDEFEIRDALESIRQMGGKVARIYTPSVRKQGESNKIIRHIEGPGKFNEEAFKAYDLVLKIANEVGIRIIIPLVDNWWWWGGPNEYAAFRNKKRDDFWTDLQLISDFKKTIEFIINRKNSYTGILYKDDMAILGWETGNELQAPFTWTAEIAQHIKSLDNNHLVIEGTHTQILTEEAINSPHLDVLSTHHYSPPDVTIERILTNKNLSENKKPYFVGEFATIHTEKLKAIIDTAFNNDVSGIMLWSLRFHNKDGGFYFHGENFNAGSYRFPGFESGNYFDEIEVMNFMREKAFAINNEPVPPPEIPGPPHLFPIEDVYSINWRGSTGASGYNIERKTGEENWITIAENFSDADIAYKPLFYDSTAVLGKKYHYRIKAVNESGISEASNVEGPVKVIYRKFIDEFDDTSKIFLSEGNFNLINNNIYRAKEDFCRLGTDSVSSVVYHFSEDITAIKLQAFLTDSSGNPGTEFYVSDSLFNFTRINPKIETFPSYKNEYKFFTPVEFTWDEFPVNSKYLKIVFRNNVQLSRAEVIYSSLSEK